MADDQLGESPMRNDFYLLRSNILQSLATLDTCNFICNFSPTRLTNGEYRANTGVRSKASSRERSISHRSRGKEEMEETGF
jgi:hypothetical protein